jgi:hypothetical protein
MPHRITVGNSRPFSREGCFDAALADRKALARSLSDALGGLVITEAGILVAGGVVVASERAA